MRRITSRIRAALGAALIIACASPAAVHAQRAPARVRAEAQWLERRGAARQLVRWQMVQRRAAATAWRRGWGYARGFVARRYPLRAAAWRRAWARAIVRERLSARSWERRRPARWGGRWPI